jgi:hypothetical protein|tara:strand:+ start:67 stop:705 length:639 start_codon:yes stop_codon:yes gene_type:complete
MSSQIPKIIHQIWVGDNPIPDYCKEFHLKMKQMHPDWEVNLWGNEIFTTYYPNDPFLSNYRKNAELYKWAFIADRIRLLLLRDYGGVYVDIDAEPIRSFNNILSKLEPHHTFFSGLKPTQENNTLLDCTVYGSAPNSRAVNLCLETYDDVNWANGCKMFSDALIAHMDTDIALFNYKYFYNWERDDPHTIVLHDVEETRLFSWVKDEEDKTW